MATINVKLKGDLYQRKVELDYLMRKKGMKPYTYLDILGLGMKLAENCEKKVRAKNAKA